MPRGLAMRWSRGAEKQIESIKRARAAREIRTVEDAKAAAERLSGLRVRMRTRRAAEVGCWVESRRPTSPQQSRMPVVQSWTVAK